MTDGIWHKLLSGTHGLKRIRCRDCVCDWRKLPAKLLVTKLPLLDVLFEDSSYKEFNAIFDWIGRGLITRNLRQN